MEKERRWAIIGFIIASSHRQRILAMLAQSKMTPNQLSKSLNLSINRVSNILRELSRENLIECLNPESRKGRLYTATTLGKEIAQFIKGMKEKAENP